MHKKQQKSPAAAPTRTAPLPTIPKGVNRATLKLYWEQMRTYKTTLIIGVVSIPVAALLLDTALPYFLSQAVGTLTNNANGLEHFLWLAAGAGTVGVIFNIIGFQSIIVHESNVRHDLLHNTVQKLLNKDADFFANQKIGALTGRLIDFINAHIGLQDLAVLRTFTFFLNIVAGLTIIFVNSAFVGCIVLGLIILILVQVRVSIYRRRFVRHRRKELVSELNGVSADILSNNQTVKTFAQEDHELHGIDALSAKYRSAHRKDFRYMSLEGSGRLALMALTQIITIAAIAHMIQQGHMQLGVAIFTIAYMQRIASNLFNLGEMINGYDKLFLQAAPMTELLLKDPTVADVPHAKNLTVRKGTITFSGVDYSYSDSADELVIKGLNLTIPAGQKVGLVGHSGAGKTTFTRLLLRFADLTKGTLSIDGQDIATVTQKSLRQAIAFVPQEPLLFHRTLRENIAYAKPHASTKQILSAARKANALEFIERLPHGLDTVVGERGIKLSGGQRQRIALARAILKDAPILVLDEATSSLDSVSERLIQDALSELMEGRTSLVIAHRLSTIASLDRIIVMDKGRIIEDGTHTELLTKDGAYANLWKHQSGGFIRE